MNEHKTLELCERCDTVNEHWILHGTSMLTKKGVIIHSMDVECGNCEHVHEVVYFVESVYDDN